MFNYKVKVRKDSFLWGGAEVTAVVNSPLLLLIRVPDEGEAIRFGVWNATTNKKVDYGKLAPGECFAISLCDASGVYGQCETDTFVECSLLLSANAYTNRKE